MMDPEKAKIILWRKPTIEVLNEHEVNNISTFRHYIGFEISGLVHLGTGIVSGFKIRDFQELGETRIFLADWHSWINNKLGGDIEKIRKVANGYFKEAMKQCIKAVGGDSEKTKFVLASEIYDNNYWAEVVKIGKYTTLSRIIRSITIMGRKGEKTIPSAWLIYPLMQAADIIFQGVNIAHAGLDQRKAHVIALEYANRINYSLIAVHHYLITNFKLSWEIYKKLKEEKDKRKLKEELSELKMSKSIPGSAIFVHDSEEEIRKKIIEAFCPANEIEFNPIWEIVEYLIFREQENIGLLLIALENKIVTEKELGIPESANKMELIKFLEDKNKRGEIDWNVIYRRMESEFYDLFKLGYNDIEFEIVNNKTGERKLYNHLWDLRRDWIGGKIHPLDLKNAVASWIITMLEPVRRYFEREGEKYLEDIHNASITR